MKQFAMITAMIGLMTAGPAVALTVIVPDPEQGARCEAQLEHGQIGPIEDAGAGRFIQRMSQHRPDTGAMQGFMFVDCERVEGVGVTERALKSGENDPYVIRRDTTAASLLRLSDERGDENHRFGSTIDEGAFISPYCGCAVLYPASPGAKITR